MKGSFVDLQRAAALLDLHRYTEAAQLSQAVVATDPDSVRAWCLLAHARLGQEESPAALDAASRAISLAPENEWPHRLASVALLSLHRPGEAIEAARTAVRLSPHGWLAHATLARALAAKGANLDEARAAADRALALAPGAAFAHYAKGLVAAADGRRDEAGASFRRTLSIDPQHSAAHNELARLSLGKRSLANAGGLAEAAGGFARAVRVNPRAQVSRRNIDVVLHVFFARLSYFVFLDAYLDATSVFRGWLGRWLPLVLLAIPAAFAARFVSRLTPDLRRYLARVLLAPRALVGASFQALAILCLIVGAMTTQVDRSSIGAAAAVPALVGRLLLSAMVGQSSRLARGLPPEPLLGRWLLWMLAVTLAIMSLFFVAAASGGAGLVGVVAAVVCASAAALTAYVIVRRRRAERLESQA